MTLTRREEQARFALIALVIGSIFVIVGMVFVPWLLVASCFSSVCSRSDGLKRCLFLDVSCALQVWVPVCKVIPFRTALWESRKEEAAVTQKAAGFEKESRKKDGTGTSQVCEFSDIVLTSFLHVFFSSRSPSCQAFVLVVYYKNQEHLVTWNSSKEASRTGEK